MKKLMLLILAVFPLTLRAGLHGQARIDSLVGELSKSKTDTNKVKLLNSISFSLSFINPDEGIRYGLQGLALARELQWKHGMAVLNNSLCYNCQAKADFALAIEYGLNALTINKELNDRKEATANLGNIANCYAAMTNYAKGLEYYFEALKIAEELHDKQTVALTFLGIGIVYNELKNYPKALEYHQNALLEFDKINDRANIATSLSNLGQVHLGMQHYGQAIDCNAKALRIFEELGNKMGIIASNQIAGEAYKLQGDYSRALEYYFASIVLSKEINNKEYIASSLCEIGEIYFRIAVDSSGKIAGDKYIPAGRQPNLHKAIEYLQQGVDVAREINTINMLIKSEELLSEAYSLSGNYEQALRHYVSFSKTKDSVFSNDNNVRIANLATERETDLKEKQIEINKLSEVKKRNERSLFSVGLGLLSLTVVVVGRNYRNQRKANNEKAKLLRQKDLLMKEIHHRVKNNLQVIGTLLDLQLCDISDECARAAMAESTTRVKSISLIHQQLYQNENITTIEFSGFTQDLLRQIAAVFNNPGQKIELKNAIQETLLDIDTAVPLGLILNELMTNSYKYAFAGRPDGWVEISLWRNKDEYRLTYKDSGPGLAVDINITTSKSLGMNVMRSLSKQVGGQFIYDSASKTFIISFKDEVGRKVID